MKILTVFIFVLFYSIVARAENIIGVELGDSSAKENTYSRDYEFKIEGKFSEKFTLKHGQCGYSKATRQDDCLRDRGRVERGGDWKRGNEHWYKFSFYVDETWPTELEYKTIIIQSKIKGATDPTWALQLEHGNLVLSFNQIKQHCKIMDYNDVANRWVNVTLYTNLADKHTKWFKNENKKAQIWIDGIPKKAFCGYSESGLVPDKLKTKNFKKYGQSIRYGIYHSYVSRDLSRLNPNITLPGWKDTHSDVGSAIESMTNDPWSIDWEILYPTKTIWWDDMQHSTAKNPWDMNLSEIDNIHSYE